MEKSVRIRRLLVYEFLDKEEAVKHLLNRGVRGTQSWSIGSSMVGIEEHFYVNSPDEQWVVDQVVTQVIQGEPPDYESI